MSNDQLFNKKKAREAENFARKEAVLREHSRILIFCGAKETELNYFKGFRTYYKIDHELLHLKGFAVDPKTLVEMAEDYKNKHGKFDEVYCVFDRDEHASYEEAKKLCEEKGFIAITSVPCFEYWLLLHFEYTTSSYERQVGKTCSKLLENALKKHIKDYSKEDLNLFDKTREKLKTAIKHAKKVEKEHKETKTDKPSTRVYILMEKLEEMTKEGLK